MVAPFQGDEGHHIDGANPGMDTPVFAHVNQIDGPFADGNCSFFNIFRCADEGQNGSVMVCIDAYIEESHSLNNGKRCGDTVYLFPFPAFTEIGDTFDNFHTLLDLVELYKNVIVNEGKQSHVS